MYKPGFKDLSKLLTYYPQKEKVISILLKVGLREKIYEEKII